MPSRPHEDYQKGEGKKKKTCCRQIQPSDSLRHGGWKLHDKLHDKHNKVTKGKLAVKILHI